MIDSLLILHNYTWIKIHQVYHTQLNTTNKLLIFIITLVLYNLQQLIYDSIKIFNSFLETIFFKCFKLIPSWSSGSITFFGWIFINSSWCSYNSIIFNLPTSLPILIREQTSKSFLIWSLTNLTHILT